MGCSFEKSCHICMCFSHIICIRITYDNFHLKSVYFQLFKTWLKHESVTLGYMTNWIMEIVI